MGKPQTGLLMIRVQFSTDKTDSQYLEKILVFLSHFLTLASLSFSDAKD